MKRILLATTAAICAGGVASAEVSLSGEGKLGLQYTKSAEQEFDTIASAKVTFTLSGTTDNNLFAEYGASFSLEGSGEADVEGNAFSVYVGSVDGPIGKIEAGSDLGAADKKSGGLGDPGLGGIGVDDIAEAYYGGSGKKLRFERALIAGTGIAFSLDLDEAWAIGGEYDMSGSILADSMGLSEFTIGAGYDTRQSPREDGGTDGVNTVSVGVLAELGNQLSGALLVSSRTTNVPAGQPMKPRQTAYGLEVGYQLGSTKFSAVYGSNDGTDDSPGSSSGWGIGVDHELGSGLSLQGAYASIDGGTKANFGFLMEF